MKQHKGLSILTITLVLSLLPFFLPVPLAAEEHGGGIGSVHVSDGIDSAQGGDSPIEPRGSASPATSSPVIDIWYGSPQTFGHLGTPQRWVNILGNVSDPDGVKSLSYTLHGNTTSLSIGPDNARLADPGDFNVDIDTTDLQNGLNEVTIRAVDNQNNSRTKTVSVQYESGNVWPNPTYIDWGTVGDIQDVAQIVDGRWRVEGDGLHVLGASARSYDRLVAVGDITWLDYEVTVPITIDQFYFAVDPGVGILVRWRGHSDDAHQPHRHPPLGGLGWYRHEPYEPQPWLSIMGNGGDLLGVDKGVQLPMGVTHIFKMRVETEPGGKSRYSLKVWTSGEPEPSAWNISGYGNTPDVPNGSLLLVAHRADATFGNVTITPIQAGYTLAIGTQGQGSVQKTPDQGVYYYGDEVTLTPNPGSGWRFDAWTGPDAGDVVDNQNGTWSIAMVKDRDITANFVQDEQFLTIDVVGNGQVEVDPDQQTYQYGQVVTLAVVGDPGWSFAGWGGFDAGDLVDKGDGTWSLTMNGDKELTANFTQTEYGLDVMVTPDGSGSVTKDPDQATYAYAAQVLLSPIPEAAWQFAEWVGPNAGDLVDNGDGTWSLTMDEDKELTARFAQGEYDVQVTIVGEGNVSQTPSGPYLYLEVATLRPTPTQGWRFVGWTGPNAGDLSDNGDGSWSVRMDGDKEVTATFARNQILLPLVTYVQ
ncbi:hypothetical protein ACFLYD_03260 [Chloroflexota bacterium]